MATIKDVAERAEVSTATVSHVINQTRFVSPELEARVREAIESLDYQPNAVARSLRGKRTRTLGMIIPDSSNPFFAEVARGIEDLCFDLGYNVILCNSDGDPSKEEAYISLLTEKRVDGIAFVAAGGTIDHISQLLDRKIPVVVVDREIKGLKADCVLTDNLDGGYQATAHLLALGHRRIGCILGPSDLTPSADRVTGYRQAMAETGLEPPDEWLRRGDFRCQSGYDAMRGFLALPEQPTAVFACNDLMAIGALCAIREAGLRVPDDVALVGFDDIALASFTTPRLTTIAQPKQEMGRLAAELLVDRIQNKERPPERRLLSTRLVIREST